MASFIFHTVVLIFHTVVLIFHTVVYLFHTVELLNDLDYCNFFCCSNYIYLENPGLEMYVFLVISKEHV